MGGDGSRYGICLKLGVELQCVSGLAVTQAGTWWKGFEAEVGTLSAVTHFQLCCIPTCNSTLCLAVGTDHPSCSSPVPKAEQGQSRQDLFQVFSLFRRVLPSELPAVRVPQKLLVT